MSHPIVPQQIENASQLIRCIGHKHTPNTSIYSWEDGLISVEQYKGNEHISSCLLIENDARALRHFLNGQFGHAAAQHPHLPDDAA